MKNKTWILRFFYLALQLSRYDCGSAYNTNLKNLFNSLTYGYVSDVRPDENVPVSVAFSLSSINELDTETGLFSVTGWFSVSWTDGNYVWEPTSFSNIDYLFISNEYCWKPQLALDNAKEGFKILNDDTQQMRVNENGIVTWEPGGVFTVHCDVDTTYFPFDRQTCYISLSSAVYDTNEVTLAHHTTDITTDSIINNPEWTVAVTATETVTHLDTRGEFSKTSLRFTFTLERNTAFYVWTLLVPYFLISSLGLVVFILPPLKGEKVNFSLTVIFLVFIFFVIFSTQTPVSRGNFPVIGTFFFLLFIFNIFELLVTALVERMHRNEREERPVPKRVQKMTYKLLARLTCFKIKPTTIDIEFNDNPMYPRRFSMPKNTRVSPSSLQQAKSSASITPPRPRNGHQIFDRIHSSQGMATTPEFDRINSAKSTRTTSDVTVSTDVSNASSTQPLQLNIPDYSWNDIACMVDRISFVIFALLDVLSTSILIALLHLYNS